MRINLLLRSLTDGSPNILPLDDVLPVDSPDVLKSKILRQYPPLANDGEFFLACNGVYFDEGPDAKIGQYGVDENSMVQVVRMAEIIQQQQEQQRAELEAQYGGQLGGEAAMAAAQAEGTAHLSSAQIASHQAALGPAADLNALAADAMGRSAVLSGGSSMSHSQRAAAAGGGQYEQNPEERAAADKELKNYKSKARRNKWRIRAELLPNDGGKTTVTVHNQHYDKIDCYQHALMYDPQDPATWSAIGAVLAAPEARTHEITLPVQGGDATTETFTPVDCFTVSLRLDPMNAHNWVNLGAALSSDLQQCVTLFDRQMNRRDCFARAAEIDPIYPRAWYNLALMLFDNPNEEGVYVGTNQETVESCLLRVLQCEPTHAGAWVSLGLLLGFSYDGADNDVVSMGDDNYDRQMCLVQALKCDAKHARAWYNLGVTLPPQSVTVHDEAQRVVFIGDDDVKYTRQMCFEKAVRYKPKAAHHWVALATELSLTSPRIVLYEDCPPMAKWDCFAKALEIDRKNSAAWCGLGQALLTCREKNIELPTSFRGVSQSACSMLLSPDMLQPKTCFESALSHKFNMSRAWMSLVYLLGKDRVVDNASSDSGSSSPPSSPTGSRKKTTRPPQNAKISGRELTLKECACYAVEYNVGDSRAWGNLAAAMNSHDEEASIRDPQNASNDEGEVQIKKVDVIQRAIALDQTKGTHVGRWWLDLAVCMSEPGTDEEYDSRPERILFMQQTSMNKYDCIEKALEYDSNLTRCWVELAHYWARRVKGERVATDKVFHDYTLLDLSVRAVSLDGTSAKSWMLLSKMIADMVDDDNDESTIDVSGTTYSFRSTLQNALLHDRHLARAWQQLAGSFNPNEQHILVNGALKTRIQCIVSALEENDAKHGTEAEYRKAQDLKNNKKGARQHALDSGGDSGRETPTQALSARKFIPLGEEEPFTDDELFELWNCLGDELLKKKQAAEEALTQKESILMTQSDLIDSTGSNSGAAGGGAGAGGDDDDEANNSTNKKVVVDQSVTIKWKSTKQTQVYHAEEAFQKALTIFSTGAASWYGLARSLSGDKRVVVDGAKWNKQSCLEKTLTFDDKIKDAWVELGQILPDDARTGCAYVSMQRVSRQQCYERAMAIDAQDPKLLCLFASALPAGQWATISGEALDQKRCLFKALGINPNYGYAWLSLGFLAGVDGKIEVPVDPAVSVEVQPESSSDEEEEEHHAPLIEITPVNGDDNDENKKEEDAAAEATPKPKALKKKRKKQKTSITYTAAECFEKAMECDQPPEASPLVPMFSI